MGQVFLGSSIASSATSSLTSPDMVVETGHPFYTKGTPNALQIGSLGDVNGDGLPDFAISDSEAGQQLHVFSGGSWTTNTLSGVPWINNFIAPTVSAVRTDRSLPG